MNKLTLPIAAGKRYLRRDGTLVQAQEPAADAKQSDNSFFVLVSSDGGKTNYTVYQRTGRFLRQGKDHGADLVSDYPQHAELTLPIVIGKKYVRRDGAVIEARSPHPTLSKTHHLAYVGDRAAAEGAGYHHAYVATGLIGNPGMERDFDLVADYVEARKGHVHAELMKQYAEDAASREDPWTLWEWQSNPGSNYWQPIEKHPHWLDGCAYRRRPPQAVINGFSFDLPCRVPPERGSIYWMPNIWSDGHFASERTWQDTNEENRMLLRGVIHRTQHAAEQHAKGLLSFTQEK